MQRRSRSKHTSKLNLTHSNAHKLTINIPCTYILYDFNKFIFFYTFVVFKRENMESAPVDQPISFSLLESHKRIRRGLSLPFSLLSIKPVPFTGNNSLSEPRTQVRHDFLWRLNTRIKSIQLVIQLDKTRCQTDKELTTRATTTK